MLIATAELGLKGVKARKLLAAVTALAQEHRCAFEPRKGNGDMEWRNGALERPLEAPLDLGTSITRVGLADMPPPPRPRIGDLRLPANPTVPRFRPRTMAEITELPADSELAAKSLGLTGPSEAKELSELAELFGASTDRGEHLGASSTSSSASPSSSTIGGGGDEFATSGLRAERGRVASKVAARAAAKAAANAAAVAMNAAAKASELVIAAAEAHARRQAMGVEDGVTPRTAAETAALATDLRSALDEASAQAKAQAQAEVARAIEKELGSALQSEVREARKKLKGHTGGAGKKNKVLNTTHIAGGGVHGFKVREDLTEHLPSSSAADAGGDDVTPAGAAEGGATVAGRTRLAKKKKAGATDATSGSESARGGGSSSGATSARGAGSARMVLGEKSTAGGAKAGAKAKGGKSKFALAAAHDKENIPPQPTSARVTRSAAGGLKFDL